ncbi:MAG TPA: SAM-dependent methyltransferase [Lachnospiraceae bacterium]|nr:SAM-dependent methyltransferase [Lachnospiraceae bacterium]
MTNNEIVAKLWNLCNVLRDDGITYHQYVTELTYILFLKMAKETDSEKGIPKNYRWDVLKSKDGLELKKYYEELLRVLGEECSGRIQEIYNGARSNIEEPANLKKIITNIDGLDWYSAKEEGLGNLYEGLLEKNANEKKSGAGQYFTPRVLIDLMTELIAPKAGEKCNDPACGTFGFMIAADAYVKEHTNDLFDLDEEEQKFQKYDAFTGGELVHETHRLALMNAMLHDIEGKIYLCDTLSNQGKVMNDFDVVLTNPPFGTKKGGERATRDDFTFTTSNKQLNFLQHIYRSLKNNGKARAAVVLPDNVLFADGDGQRIREDLMNKCNLHTVLRLPTGIFYAQGVKTNVLFFTRGTSDHDNTSEVWFYDLRTNMPSFGKTNPLKEEHFEDFKKAYTASNRHDIKDERWSVYTYEQIAEEGKNHSLDLGLIKDDSVIDYSDLPDPIESGEECIAQLEEAVDLLQSVVKELKSLEDNHDR